MTRTVEKPTGLVTLDEAKNVLGFSVPVAARLAGVSPSAMYLACERGEVESIRLCGRILVKSVPFMRLFGLDVDDKALADPTASLFSGPAHECTSRAGRTKRGR